MNDSQEHSRPLAAVARNIAILSVLYPIFVIYGSLVPFDMSPRPFAALVQAFLNIPFLEIGAEARGDWVANLVLYMPLGLLWSANAASWPTARLTRAGAIRIWLLATAMAIAIEFVQLLFPGRTVSLNDLIAEVAGVLIGIWIWRRVGARIVRGLNEIVSGGAFALVAALAAYFALYLFISLFPFDIVVSLSELNERRASGNIGPYVAAACGGVLRCSVSLGFEVLAAVPLGLLLLLRRRIFGRPPPGLLHAAVLGLVLGMLIEFLQIFLVSGVVQGASLLTRAAGVALGVAVVRRPVLERLASGRRFFVAGTTIAAVGYVVAAIVVSWGRGDGWLSPADAADRLDKLHFLPFYYHYFITEQAALFSAVANFALYVPVGVLVWAWQKSVRHRPSLTVPVGLLAAAFAVVVETGLLFRAGIRPDPTNILIGFAAGIFGYATFIWIDRSLARQRLAAIAPYRAAPAEARGVPPAGRLPRRLRPLTTYFTVVGVAAHLLPVAAVYWAMSYYDVSFRRLVEKGLESSGIEAPWLSAALAPRQRHTRYVMDGRPIGSHPRILLPELSLWRGAGPSEVGATRLQLYERVGIDAPDQRRYCQSAEMLPLAVCWITTGSRDAGAIAVRQLLRMKVRTQILSDVDSPEEIGNGWQAAFAFDLLYNHPNFTAAARSEVRGRIAAATRRFLEHLDGDVLSLWHTRTSLAAQTWIMAVVLDGDDPAMADLQRRAQAYFMDAMNALALSEAWPEGYTYWINSRALLVALGAAAYVNGLTRARNVSFVADTLRRTGLWHIYAARPDNRIEAIGDEGSRVDQRDESRRFIDIVAQITRDRLMSAYSRYTGQLHGRASYYSGHRWGFPLFNDPTVAPVVEIKGPSLAPIGDLLPKAELFGRGAMNLAYIRSGWAAEDTFISFRAGATLSHHAHYDAGHFTLFKGAPLAANASLYGGFLTPNRLNYAIRTVAKNSILVLRPNERVKPNRLFDTSIADGGQRLTIPTGSAIRNVDQWRANLNAGRHLEGGRIRTWHNNDREFVYAAASLTGAYNRPEFDSGGSGGKVRQVDRELVYLRRDDILIVRDIVEATDRRYTKKWLLHAVTKPDIGTFRVLRGDPSDGILESSTDTARIANGTGRLIVKRLAPAGGLMRIVGGPMHRFYVEADGDDSDLDGINVSGGAKDQDWFDGTTWRLEIQPRDERQMHAFVVALIPSLASFREDTVVAVKPSAGRGTIVASQNAVVAFWNVGDKRLKFRNPGNQRWIYVVGLPGRATVIADARAEGISARSRAIDRTAALTMLVSPNAEIELSLADADN